MAKRAGDGPAKSNVHEADLAFRLKMVKRQSQAVKDYQTHSLHIKGKRRKMAMDYVSPGDGGY